MAKIVARQIVPGSQELVWHVLSDFERTSEWVPSAVSVEHTGGPPKAMGREHTVRYDSGLEAHQRVGRFSTPRVADRTGNAGRA